MARWFEDKFENRKARAYTRRNLKNSGSFFRKLSITNWLVLANILVYIFLIVLFPNEVAVVDGQVVETTSVFLMENIALFKNNGASPVHTGV